MQHEYLQKISTIAEKIPNPQNYFLGTAQLDCPVPKNVLLFVRRYSRELGDEAKDGRKDFHHRYVLIVNCDGPGFVMVDNNLVQFNPGQALIIFPHQFHHPFTSSQQPICWIFITFEVDDAKTLSFLRNLPFIMDESIGQSLLMLVQLYNPKIKSHNNSTILLTSLLINNLLIRSQTDAAKTLPKHRIKTVPLPDLIHTINNYIYSNISKPLALSTLAHRHAISTGHLRKIYFNATGLTLGAYIKELRINHATMLLERGSMNVSQIAISCGFSSIYSFSRAFKSRMGISPLAYRSTRYAS